MLYTLDTKLEDEALREMVADRHGVGFSDRVKLSLERRDIARNALSAWEKANA